MKRIAFFLLPFSALFFFSCQKEYTGDIDTTPSSSFNKIKTYTEDVTSAGSHSVVTYNLNYDANNRIVSLISTSNPGDKFLYQYNSDNTTTLDLFNSNVLSIHEIFFLNSSSLPDSTFQYNDTNDTSTEKYSYNAANQLVSIKQYDYTIAGGAVLTDIYTYAYDTSGNVASETNNSSVTTYMYTNIVYSVSIYPFAAAIPTKLVQTTTQTSGGTTEVVNSTYTFDSQNRISTEKDELAGSSDVVIKTYTYY